MNILSPETKIAITGGAGYIGSFTTKYFQEHGYKNIVILDNFSTGHKDKCYARYIEVDLLDKTRLSEIFAQEKFEAVIHFAALISVEESMVNPYRYFHHNIDSSLNLLDVMKDNFVKHIVFSSTCAVYGKPDQLPIAETTPLHPESVYAESKHMIESMIQWYHRLYGIQYAILRYFNACGAAADGSNGEMHRPETHIIPSVLHKALTGEKMMLYGNDYPTPDGTCVRDYIHVEDLASAHVLALQHSMEQQSSDIFNLGTGTGYSNLQIAQAVQTILKENGKNVDYSFGPRRAGDVPTLYADSTKAKTILGWEPHHTDIKTIVAEAYRWHIAQQGE